MTPVTLAELRGFLQSQIEADVDEFLAALNAVGLAIVPREPTRPMRDFGYTEMCRQNCDREHPNEELVYRAMIGAFERAK